MEHREAPDELVLGIRISAVGMTESVNAIERRLYAAESGQVPTHVTVAAVHSVIDAQDATAAKAVMNSGMLCVPDGVPLVWLLRSAGHSNVGRVFGPDLMLEVCRRLAPRGLRCFYYGAGAGVAEELAGKLAARFPGLVTAGAFSPPFRPLTDDEEAGIVALIESARPDIVWIGLSSPKQEMWIARFRARLTAPIMIAVGAAFDYNTGRIRRAPRWMQKCALEWLYRIFQDPARLLRRYARANPLFILYLALEKLGLRKFT